MKKGGNRALSTVHAIQGKFLNLVKIFQILTILPIGLVGYDYDLGRGRNYQGPLCRIPYDLLPTLDPSNTSQLYCYPMAWLHIRKAVNPCIVGNLTQDPSFC